MKALWVVLAVILLIIILKPRSIVQKPPDVENRSPAAVPKTTVKPPHVKNPSPDAVPETAPENPNAIAVVARGLSLVPGAIVCPDFYRLKMMFSSYTESAAEKMDNAMTNGGYSAVNGPPMPMPDFRSHGCALLPRGTPMRMENNNGPFSVVTAKLPNGRTITGITYPSMVDYPPEVRRKQQELQSTQGQRYEEIMGPEAERHAQVLKQEHDRHVAIMRQLNPLYIEASGVSNVNCIDANCQGEVKRYDDAVRQENARFLSSSQEAWKQAKQPQPGEP
jgi:hypothetical protein